MAGVVAACVIAITCGAAFYSSINPVKRPLPGLQLDTETSLLQKLDLYDRETAADQTVNVFRYFSNDQNYERRKNGEPLLFNFPKKSAVPLGIVHYWDGRDVSAGAEGVKEFPAKAQLILESQDPNVPPCVMAHFCPTDLCGVWLKSPFRNLPVDDFLGQVCLLDGLQIFVTDATMSDRVLNHIGQLPHLRWLGLNGSCIHTVGDPHRRIITGADLAALPNISNLRILQTGDVCNVTPLLRKLAEKPALKRRWIEQFLPAGFNKADLAFKESGDSFKLLPHWFDPTGEDLIKSGIVDKSE